MEIVRFRNSGLKMIKSINWPYLNHFRAYFVTLKAQINNFINQIVSFSYQPYGYARIIFDPR